MSLDHLVVALMSGSGSVLWGWSFWMKSPAVLLMNAAARLHCCCVTVCAAVRTMFPLAVHLAAETWTAGVKTVAGLRGYLRQALCLYPLR